MSDIDAITNGKNFSGEMFDLTASSFNNIFGFHHNKAVMEYGINLPLNKFIDELATIAKTTQDDKSDKRAFRLFFLNSCMGSMEVEKLFTLFCNYVNGGGTKLPGEDWKNSQYINSFMVITAAGGNIVILFAQLIINMIDAFTKTINTREGGDVPTWNWDIQSVDPVYIPESFLPEEEGGLQYFTYAMLMFSTSLESWTDDYKDIIRKTFDLLTPTNKVLLNGLASEIEKHTNQELCFIIVKYFIEANVSNPEILTTLKYVAQSKYSDFDFKLSPNIHPSSKGESKYGSLPDTVERLKLHTIDPGHPGFLLLRVKTLIDCRADHVQLYTTKELKKFQKDCASSSKLGPKIWGLFPQLMQESYLSDVPVGSDCWHYLNHLLQKKQAIILATSYSIDETMKFHLAGYDKQSNPAGDRFSVVSPAKNSTEAIINYIANTTYNLNLYIEQWETITGTLGPKGKFRRVHKLSKYAAPALNQDGLPEDYSYELVCNNFKSLDSILYGDNGLVSRLASDILNYFLNHPDFNTELILDNLLKSFNIKKEILTGKPSNAIMNPSTLTLVPTNKHFNKSLSKIKTNFDNAAFSVPVEEEDEDEEFFTGYPNGIRITINAIKSEDKTVDTQIDNIELEAQKECEKTTGTKPGYVHLQERKDIGKGIINKLRLQKLREKQRSRRKQHKYKKVRTLKNVRSRRKHKSKKHKSKAHKSRKYKI